MVETGFKSRGAGTFKYVAEFVLVELTPAWFGNSHRPCTAGSTGLPCAACCTASLEGSTGLPCAAFHSRPSSGHRECPYPPRGVFRKLGSQVRFRTCMSQWSPMCSVVYSW